MSPQKRLGRLKSPLRAAAYVLGGISIFSGLLCVPFLVFNMGAAALLLFGAVVILLAYLWDRFDGWGRIPRRLHEVSDLRRPPAPLWWRRLRTALCLLLSLSLVVCAGISLAMIRAIRNAPGPAATVVVLGCKVYGNQPSLMMERRLDAALEYLNSHPEAPVVCSGGKTPGDPYSEAEVMAMYLAGRGVAPERIYLEGQSASTAENIRFSAQIIRDKGLPAEVAIATDGFHQLRGQIYAGKNGLDGRGLPTMTPWGIAPSYWVREWLGIAKAVLVG